MANFQLVVCWVRPALKGIKLLQPNCSEKCAAKLGSVIQPRKHLILQLVGRRYHLRARIFLQSDPPYLTCSLVQFCFLGIF